jgi:hypothetical protein
MGGRFHAWRLTTDLNLIPSSVTLPVRPGISAPDHKQSVALGSKFWPQRASQGQVSDDQFAPLGGPTRPLAIVGVVGGGGTCVVLSDKGAGGQAAARESGGRPLGGRLPGLERFGGALSMLLRSLRSLRTAPASQLSMLAALAAPEPLKPGASHARCGLPARAFARHRGLRRNACHRLCRRAARSAWPVGRVALRTPPRLHATALAGERPGVWARWAGWR